MRSYHFSTLNNIGFTSIDRRDHRQHIIGKWFYKEVLKHKLEDGTTLVASAPYASMFPDAVCLFTNIPPVLLTVRYRPRDLSAVAAGFLLSCKPQWLFAGSFSLLLLAVAAGMPVCPTTVTGRSSDKSSTVYARLTLTDHPVSPSPNGPFHLACDNTKTVYISISVKSRTSCAPRQANLVPPRYPRAFVALASRRVRRM
ncbi:hypothetical protein CBL_04286 [Carabus blaptoides fortunei]